MKRIPLNVRCNSAGRGWCAAEPGPQVIRLLFDQPQKLERILLDFLDFEETETQRLKTAKKIL